MPCETTPIHLTGSAKDTGVMRLCGGCHVTTTTGGGVQMTPKKWFCGTCWKTRQIGAATRSRNLAKVAR